MKSILVILLTALGPLASADDFDITGVTDNDAACRALIRWSTSIGMKPERVFEDSNFVIRENARWFVGVKASVNSSIPDRLIIRAMWKGAPGNLSNPGAYRFVNKLNNSYNVCSFAMDSDGDFIAEFNLPFDDKLSPGLYRKFFRHSDFCFASIYEKHSADFRLYSK